MAVAVQTWLDDVDVWLEVKDTNVFSHLNFHTRMFRKQLGGKQQSYMRNSVKLEAQETKYSVKPDNAPLCSRSTDIRRAARQKGRRFWLYHTFAYPPLKYKNLKYELDNTNVFKLLVLKSLRVSV